MAAKFSKERVRAMRDLAHANWRAGGMAQKQLAPAWQVLPTQPREEEIWAAAAAAQDLPRPYVSGVVIVTNKKELATSLPPVGPSVTVGASCRAFGRGCAVLKCSSKPAARCRQRCAGCHSLWLEHTNQSC